MKTGTSSERLIPTGTSREREQPLRAYCVFKHPPFWKSPFPSFWIPLYKPYDHISEILPYLLIVSNVHAKHVINLVINEYTIHRGTVEGLQQHHSGCHPPPPPPPPIFIYSFNVNYISYLVYFSSIWLPLTCILNTSNIHFVITKCTIPWGYCVLKHSPL